jgi:glycosyltransferase involved in cell wall biosynthesis
VEHEIWERITQNTGSKLRKWYLGYLTRKLKKYEIEQFSSYDYLVTLTERDLKQFKDKGYKNGASSAPIGFDSNLYPYSKPELGPEMSMCFIGSLDWMPNLEGLNWFLQTCWPQINRKWPQLQFHIAGRNTPLSLMQLKMPNVTVHGEIADAIDFMSRHSIMIVPLFSGSGMRVKIVEGMVMGKVIITTSLGKEGINGSHKEHLLVANDAKQFLDSISFCIDHPDEALAIGQRAQEMANQQFNGQLAAEQIMHIYKKLMNYKSEVAAHSPATTLSV